MPGRAILPIAADPPVKGYLRHAFLFSILATDDAYLPWLYGGNYTQLVFDYDPVWMPLDFYSPLGYSGTGFACPFLDTQWIARAVIDNGYGSIVPFLIDSIDGDYYARLVVDEFYLPERGAYQQRHFLHSLLVFGYDRKRAVFHVLGYRQNGEYGPSEVGFKQLEEAFDIGEREGVKSNAAARARHQGQFDGVGSRAELRSWVYSRKLSNVDLNRLWLVRYNRQARFRFDFQAAWLMMEDFLHSICTPSRFAALATFPNKVYTLGQEIPVREDNVFGMKIYDCLARWMELILAGRREFDIIPFHILWEHKRVMVARLEYFERHGYFDHALECSTRYREIEAMVAHLRLLMVRCQMKQDPKLLARSIARLGKIRDCETQLLTQFLGAAQETCTGDQK